MPAVALLFDDAELVAHLRAALQERGMRIVHEGPLAGASGEQLRDCGAEVAVVNLDGDGDDDVDHLHAMFGDGKLRAVFNDAEASRGLDGWDRARWARHLAVKVLAAGELEPPRPPGARAVETRPAPVPAPPPPAGPAPAFLAEGGPADEAESLAAELEALLAAEAPADRQDLPAPPPAEPALAVLHEGIFEFGLAEEGSTFADAPAGPGAGDGPVRAALAGLGDGLSLAPLEYAAPLAAAPIRRETVGAPSAWSLLDEGEEPPSPSRFGIDKLSAAEYLAPPAPEVADDGAPLGLSLELVSIEEALAPQPHAGEQEMLLSVPDGAVRRLLLLGLAEAGAEAAQAFLAALPADFRLPLLLVTDGRGQPAEHVAARLAVGSAIPVGVAAADARLRPGQALVVPDGWLARPSRDSRLALRMLAGEDAAAPLDAGFAAAAEAFGRDLLAIVFAGRTGDGLAGAQAVRERGGLVWVEASTGHEADDLAAAVAAAGLAAFSGTPPQLAARLSHDDAWREGA